MKKHWILAGIFAFGIAHLAHSQENTLKSPDGRLVMTFSINASGPMSDGGSGRLQYALTYKGTPIVDASALGLDLDGKLPLGENVTIANAKASNGTDDYPLLFGKTSHVHDSYNALAVTVRESEGKGGGGRRMTVEARAYNNGIAFRYLLPAQGGVPDLHLKDEETEFRFSQDDTAWVLALPNYRSSYESEYVRYNLSALSNQGGVASKFLIGMPTLLHQPGGAWLSLMEADLEGNSSAYVTNPTGSWAGHMFRVKLSPRWDDPTYAVTGTLPHHSAWRVLGVADTPGALIESNLQTNLNPENRLKDTSWIKGGKASWNWWVDNVNAKGESGNAQFTTETMKYYVDFAAKSGFPYFFLDAGWSSGDITKMNGKVDIPELVRYAKTKNVKVWIWLYSTSVMAQMKEAFPLYEKWGVAGLKIDFINRDDQEGIDFFYDVARTAAENHLMVDFHGCHTPWGIMRTYPNVLSYESVLGLENNKVGRRDSPVDRAVFAWTRSLVGPMDYTAGAFDNQTEDNYVARNAAPQVMGTRAQQLALYVVYENPVPMVSDSPQNYEGEAAPAFQFLKDVPTTWDETHVVGGEVGEYSTVARRHGKEWYLGSMTNWNPRDLHIPLAFLGGGNYTAEVYEDGADAATQPKHVNIRKIPVTAGSTLDVKLAPGGGAAVRFVPAR
jgi:alpha-glucosidase